MNRWADEGSFTLPEFLFSGDLPNLTYLLMIKPNGKQKQNQKIKK